MSWIDFTQFTAWQRCPWYWYERYVRCLAKPRTGPTDDALTIGALVHSAIENLLARGVTDIQPRDDIQPTRDAVDMARMMVSAYVATFPPGGDGWRVERVEAPLRDGPIVAKVDALFRVEADATVADGTGHILALEPGLWALEHKTTSAATPRDVFMRRWLMDKQADFQMLVSGARGVVINVISRPSQRKSTRTCTACGADSDVAFVNWDAPACTVCGARQRWQKPRPADPPTVWRFAVTRTADQLATAKRQILSVLADMERMRANPHDFVPNYRSCTEWLTTCPFLDLHLYGTDPTLIQIDNPTHYLGDLT